MIHSDRNTIALALLAVTLTAPLMPATAIAEEDPFCVDADGDGVESVACGGADCDDKDPNRYPGNTEICDARGHDEDCDPRTVGSRDLDGDGYDSDECR